MDKKPNKQTEASMLEAEEILHGLREAKRYNSAAELFTELDAEECEEIAANSSGA